MGNSFFFNLATQFIEDRSDAACRVVYVGFAEVLALRVALFSASSCKGPTGSVFGHLPLRLLLVYPAQLYGLHGGQHIVHPEDASPVEQRDGIEALGAE